MDNILSFLPEFDDFRKLKSIHNSIKRVIGKSDKSRDGLGAAGQIKVRYYERVICEYYIHYGVEFLREQVNLKIESVKFREVVNDYITKALEYRESERLAFEESVNSAGKLLSKKLNSIYDFIMLYTEGELSVEGFNMGEPEYAASGEFNLPWNFVSFMDGYMLLYHPMHPQGNFGYLPFRYNDVRCKKAFNSVKSYIIKKLKPIYATALRHNHIKPHSSHFPPI